MSAYNLNKELENAQKERVWLKSGAYLVIQQTEAMVVIDVNTGKSTGSTSIDEHLLKVNKQAAIETCRQIRLRNLSGIIIVDFINMRNPSDMEEIKAVILEELKKDFDAAKFVDITKLGLVEMTRKRTRKSLKEQLVY
jgi:ribonuclease G